MSLHPRRRVRTVRRLATQWRTLTILAVLWVMLWGDLSWANVLAGLAVGAVVVMLFPLPPVRTRGTLRVWPFLTLAGHFVVEVFKASFEVAWIAIRPGHQPRGGIVGVRLRTTDDVFLTLTAEMTSLVPGSVVVEVHRAAGTLYLHVLDLSLSGGPDGVRASTLALEARILRALAPDGVLDRVGLRGSHELVSEEGRR